MTLRVAAAITALDRVFETSTWLLPTAASWHRTELKQVARSERSTYPHSFAYPAIPLADYITEIDEVRQVAERDLGGGLHTAVLEELGRRALWAEGVKARDHAALTRVETLSHGVPTQALVDEAQRILSDRFDLSVTPNDVSAPELKSLLEAALSAYGLHDWFVEESDAMASKASVNGALKRIRVRAGASFTRRGADRLIVHELGGHVLRWANSAAQPEPLAQVPLGATVATEEGLAIWLESQFDLLDRQVIRTYAARVLAVHTAQTHGIIGVVRVLLDHMSIDDAIEIALRAKRGLVDPNAPGGATKDWNYLGGLRMIQELHEQSPEDVQLLQNVKWSSQHLPLARQLAAAGRITRTAHRPDPTRLGLSLRSLDASEHLPT